MVAHLFSIALQTLPDQNYVEDEEFNLFLFAILIVGVIAVLLCLLIGIILTILALLAIFGLIAMGALSASLLVGIAKRSVTKGFKVFVMVFSTFASATIGSLTFWFLNTVFEWWTDVKAITIGLIIGLLSGFLTGFAIAFVIQKLAPILKRKVEKIRNGKSVPKTF